MTTRDITVIESNSVTDGGCNGCSEHFSIDRIIPHRVWRIDLRSISIRLCDDCIVELFDKSTFQFRKIK